MFNVAEVFQVGQQFLTDVGTRLREARERRGVTLHEIANVTKISMVTLKAIERNDIARLPGGIFTRGYIRAFAGQVGLDPEKVVADYVAQCEVVEEPPEVSDVDQDSRADRVRLIAVLALGLGLTIYAASFFSGSDELPSESLAVDVVLAIHESDIPKTFAFAAALAAAENDLPALQLELELRGRCWVSASADGRLVIYRLMERGERAVIDAYAAIELHVGDAGSFAYWINGALGRELGQTGDVTTIHITQDNYRTFLKNAAGSASRTSGTARGVLAAP